MIEIHDARFEMHLRSYKFRDKQYAGYRKPPCATILSIFRALTFRSIQRIYCLADGP